MRVIQCLVLALALHAALAADGVEVKEAKRMLDLTTQLVKETTRALYANNGQAAVNSVQIALPAEQLAYVYVSHKDVELAVTAGGTVVKGDVEYALFDVELDVTLDVGKKIRLEIYSVHTRMFSPLPKKQIQNHRAAVELRYNSLFTSPYVVVEQSTKIETGSLIVISSDAKQPFREDGSKVLLGPYKDQQPFSAAPLYLHYENASPFAVFTEAVREIEISHWGNVAVEEHYELRNIGADLEGPFSRLDYQHGVTGNSFEELVMSLPGDATDLYYRDVIGNISTSHVFPDSEGKLRFEYMPRFVMFGGWRTQFYMGYNLPASNYITYEGSRYTLTIDFAKDIEDAVIDEMEIRIIFPEGASDFNVEAPHRIGEVLASQRFTYLDVGGRPVLTFNAKNIVSDHNDPMQISYSFASSNLLWEPLYLVLAFFALCSLFMVAVRVDLSISPEKVVQSSVSAGDLERIATLREQYAERERAYKSDAARNRKTIQDCGRQIAELSKHVEDSRLKRITNVIERSEEDRVAALAELEKLKKKSSKKTADQVQEEADAAEQKLAEATSLIAQLIAELD